MDRLPGLAESRDRSMEENRRLFRETVAEAWELGRRGAVDAGYERLDLGLAWAEAPRIDPQTGRRRDGDGSDVRLALRFRLALMRYADQFAVSAAASCQSSFLAGPGLPWRRSLLLCEESRRLQQEAFQARASARAQSERLRELRTRGAARR